MVSLDITLCCVARTGYRTRGEKYLPSGSGAKPIKKWVYFESLMFLEPYMTERNTSTNLKKVSNNTTNRSLCNNVSSQSYAKAYMLNDDGILVSDEAEESDQNTEEYNSQTNPHVDDETYSPSVSDAPSTPEGPTSGSRKKRKSKLNPVNERFLTIGLGTNPPIEFLNRIQPVINEDNFMEMLNEESTTADSPIYCQEENLINNRRTDIDDLTGGYVVLQSTDITNDLLMENEIKEENQTTKQDENELILHTNKIAFDEDSSDLDWFSSDSSDEYNLEIPPQTKRIRVQKIEEVLEKYSDN
ncbi:hypothetical protein FQA39_LY16087 [Lamprigera yunnana]|nr:hypothetical protein FQA39_LY16087 [Lamprigera yunnana]